MAARKNTKSAVACGAAAALSQSVKSWKLNHEPPWQKPDWLQSIGLAWDTEVPPPLGSALAGATFKAAAEIARTAAIASFLIMIYLRFVA